MSNQLRRARGNVVYIGEEYRRRWGAPGVIVYNTISRDFEVAGEASVTQRQRGVTLKPLTFGFLGGVSQIKGSLDLLRAWHLLGLKASEGRLIIGGIPRHHDLSLSAKWLRKMAKFTQIRTYWQRCERLWGQLDGCELREFQLDLAPFFGEIDVLIFPATRDHFPRPVIEAAAFGVGSIVTRLPSLTDVVEEGVTGFTCAVGNPRSLADTMRRCVLDHKMVQLVGMQANQKYRKTFSTTGSLSKLNSLYRGLLKCQ